MLTRKNTTILSEIQQYFSSTEKAAQTLFELLKSLKIAGSFHAPIDKVNSKYSGKQLFLMLLLFPFFAVKDVSHFSVSNLRKFCECGKDVFYEFMNNPLLNWRKLLAQITRQKWQHQISLQR